MVRSGKFRLIQGSSRSEYVR